MPAVFPTHPVRQAPSSARKTASLSNSPPVGFSPWSCPRWQLAYQVPPGEMYVADVWGHRTPLPGDRAGPFALSRPPVSCVSRRSAPTGPVVFASCVRP